MNRYKTYSEELNNEMPSDNHQAMMRLCRVIELLKRENAELEEEVKSLRAENQRLKSTQAPPKAAELMSYRGGFRQLSLQ